MQAIDQVVNSAAKSHYMSGGQIKVVKVYGMMFDLCSR
jgi:pyruvate/2-oxoglutarate/acetoin dehydrogenase E1 component